MCVLLAMRCGGGLRTAVCAVAVLLLTARTGSGEVLFHLRDVHDQPQDTGNPKTISNKEEAKTYLEKYGYLNCQGNRSRREIPIAEEGNGNRGNFNCSDAEIQEALRKLQRHLNLNQSGQLDDSTKQKMSTERCGNEDKDPPAGLHKMSDDRASLRRSGARALRGRDDDLGLHAHEADGVPSPSPSPQSRGSRARRSLPSASSKSLLTRLHSPAVSEGQATMPHRQSSDDDIRRQVRIRKLLKRKKRNANVFLDMIEKHKQRVKRRKRSTAENVGHQFNAETRTVTWDFPEEFLSGAIPEVDQQVLVSRAFRMWSEVLPMNFLTQVAPDITVGFGKVQHMGCRKKFDGRGGEVAHSWAGGDIHMDQEENYASTVSRTNGVDLLRVAIHEIGHVLGLEHSDNPESAMYPLIQASSENFELPLVDRIAIQAIYGICKGSFDVVLDWLRLDQPVDVANPRYVFNTYFFRGNHYWMYENRYSRTRYGDPLHVVAHWNGLPENLDAYTQVRQRTSSPYLFHVETYFFKGANVYLYDDARDKVADGYPKRISQRFAANGSRWEPIPDNLDAVFYHMVDNMIFFFKDNWVWKYPGSTTGVATDACCEEKMLFVDMFPNQEVIGPLVDGYIDTVYYSFQRLKTYILRGDQIYEMIPDGVRWRLVQLGPWYDYWYDICDVE